MDAQQILYTPEQAATLLSLGRSKVFELLASGQISSVQIGRSRRIPRRALETFAAGLTESQDDRAAGAVGLEPLAMAARSQLDPAPPELGEHPGPAVVNQADPHNRPELLGGQRLQHRDRR